MVAGVGDSNCDRDQKGRDPNGKPGETRLWVPSDEMRERKKGRCCNSRVVEKSKQLKNLDEESLNQLKDFASMRVADAEFLRGKRLSQQDVSASPATPNDSGEKSDNEATHPAKTVDLGLEKPKISSKIGSELRSILSSLQEAFKKAVEQLKQLPSDQDRGCGCCVAVVVAPVACVYSSELTVGILWFTMRMRNTIP